MILKYKNIKVSKLYLYWLIFFIFSFTSRLLWISYFGLTDDFEWYINPERQIQYTILGYEKGLPLFIIDIFELKSTRILIAILISSLFFSIAVYRFFLFYSLSENVSINNLLFIFFLFTFCLYFTQLDVHLWRQQISFYIFIIALTIDKTFFRFMAYFISFIFHEVILVLILGFLIFKIVRKKIPSILLSRHIITIYGALLIVLSFFTGYFQLIFISLMGIIISFLNIKNSKAAEFVSYALIFSIFSLIILIFFKYVGLGEASIERLVFMSITAGLFFILSINTSKIDIKNAEKKPSLNAYFLSSLKILFIFYYGISATII